MIRNKRGFTLIEVLLAASLVVVVAALMFTFFGQGISLYSDESQLAQEQSGLRRVLSDITNRVRLAPDTVTVSGTTLTVGSMVYTYDSTNECVKRNGTVLASDVSAFIVQITGTRLDISINSVSGKAVSTSISLS